MVSAIRIFHRVFQLFLIIMIAIQLVNASQNDGNGLQKHQQKYIYGRKVKSPLVEKRGYKRPLPEKSAYVKPQPAKLSRFGRGNHV